MASEGYGGFAEGMVAGFTTVTGFMQRAQQLKMAKKEMEMKEQQMDWQRMTHMSSILQADLNPEMNDKMFGGIMGLMKKYSNQLGLDPKDFDGMDMSYEQNKETFKEIPAKIAKVTSMVKKGEISQAEGFASLMATANGFNSKRKESVTKMAEQAAKSWETEAGREQSKEASLLSLLGSEGRVRRAAKGEGDISLLGQEWTAESTEELPDEKRAAELKSAKELAAYKEGIKSDKTTLSANEKRLRYGELRTYTQQMYGWSEEKGWASDSDVKEIEKVQAMARRFLDHPFIDPQTSELRFPTIPEAFSMAKKGYQKTAGKEAFKDIPKKEEGLFGVDMLGGNVKQTKSAVQKAYKAGVSGAEVIKTLEEKDYSDADLLNVSREHKEIDTVTTSLERELKKAKVEERWYRTDSMPGVKFYWNGSKITKIGTE